jgi:hypothetical protein
MVLMYRTGEEIRRGDRIRFHGNAAEIGAVASNSFCDPNDAATTWYGQEYGGGVMILDPMGSGRTFIRAGEIPGYEDLEFISRAEAK